MECIFVYGAGGQGKVILDTMKQAKVPYGVAQIIDDNDKLQGSRLLGHAIRGVESVNGDRGFIAIGNNVARLGIASRYRGRLVSIVHRAAILAQDVPVGEGSVLMAGSIVNIGSSIGDNVIINTAATVDHDCVIEDGVHIAPGCHLCGNVRVGAGTLLGAGAVVVPGIRIGRNVLVHAGVTVTRDVPDGATVKAA